MPVDSFQEVIAVGVIAGLPNVESAEVIDSSKKRRVRVCICGQRYVGYGVEVVERESGRVTSDRELGVTGTGGTKGVPRDLLEQRPRICQAKAFPVEKAKELVPQQRAADIPAKLVLVHRHVAPIVESGQGGVA